MKRKFTWCIIKKGECEAARGEKAKALDSFQMTIKMIKKNAGLKQNQGGIKKLRGQEGVGWWV